MKNSRAVLTALVILLFGLILSLVWAQAADVSSVKLDPVAGLELVAPKDLPKHGTFWFLQRANSPPAPCNSFPELPVYWLNKERNVFLLDDRSVDYVALYKQRLATRMMKAAALGMSLAEMELMESGGSYAVSYSTNDLWLEIIQMTNTTADLVIHPPWNVTNSVYDLYFRTNLNLNPTSPFSLQWSRIERPTPGQTNLVVTHLLSDQGFFRLGPLTNAIRPGFDQQFLARNDDNYCCGVDGSVGTPLTNLLATLPFAVNFFGSTNTSLYVNNNGNVTFNDQLPTYTPEGLASIAKRIIAPYWADVDTRNTNSDVVRFGTNVVDGHSAFGVNWVNVGYYVAYVGGADKLLSCQLVIIDRSDIATNDFDLEFNYDRVEWEWGDASIGYPPRAGYSDGGTNSYELPGSGVEGAFLDSNFDTGLIYHSLDGPRTNLVSSPVSGRYRFFFRNGVPLP